MRRMINEFIEYPRKCYGLLVVTLIMGNAVNVILISRKRNLTHKIRMPFVFIAAGAIIFSFILVVTVILSIRSVKYHVANVHTTNLQRDNEYLSSKLDSLHDALKVRSTGLEKSIAMDGCQRIFLEMPLMPPDIWSMGVGGSVREFAHGHLSSSTKNTLEEIYATIDILRGRCHLRGNSLSDIGQKFEQKLHLFAHIPSVNPLPGRPLGSPFGYRIDPFTKAIRMHWGVDIGAPTGTPIHAPADGVVVFTGWNQGFGLTIEIDHGYGFITRYAHCQTILSEPGDNVKRGQIIAKVGSTGRSTCPHLHYELSISGAKVDPAGYIDLADVIYD